MRNPAFLQFPDARSRFLPLIPDDSPESASDPVLKRAKFVGTLRDPVVIPTVPQVLVKFENNLMNALAATPPGQLAYTTEGCHPSS